MMSARYAEVAVNIPVRPGYAGVEGEMRQAVTFHYHIPPALPVQRGHLVWVSFGAQQAQGLVVALSETTPVAETKPILAICDPQPYLTVAQQELARWMAQYYLSSLSDAAFSLLPPGIEQRSETVIESVPDVALALLEDLNAEQKRVWEIIRHKQRLSLDALQRHTRLPQTRSIVDQLLRRGLISKRQEVAPPRVRPRMVRTTWLLVDGERVRAEIARIHEPRLRRARVLRALLESAQPLPIATLLERAQCPRETVADLVDRGLVSLAAQRGPASLAAESALIQDALADFETPPASGRAGLLAFLAEHNEVMNVTELIKVTGTSSAQIKALADEGLVHIEEREARRDPLALRTFVQTLPPALTPVQESVCQAARDELCCITSGERLPRPILLMGVTGSGKTEIYLRILADTLALGRQAIIMVPEIALTPQTIQRFASRFPGNVAVLHSGLSLGEHFDEWRRIRDGLVDIVVGSRSAVFAPLPRLGLIVIDEEHEWTYKQTDVAPRYHARDVALKLAEITRSLLIMGSATPDVGSYQRALNGEFKLLEMQERVVRSESAQQGSGSREQGVASGEQGGKGVTVVESPLPPVEVVDLRSELKEGNRSIFSRSLLNAMRVALDASQQIILFLNRRGSATFVMCRDCGHVVQCKKCAASLGYHQAEEQLVCHQCNRRYAIPQKCPQCWSKRIKFFGIGTQRVEEEVHKLFPSARLLRWDRDVTQGKLAHELILDRFSHHDADILIGTQMIAKGLDLPLVTLVGVVSADTVLHLPDFRAGERTFQLLTQVAGRAGRSALGGRVIIQTYTPEHYAIQAASHHDYRSFVAQELAFRTALGYPPFSRLARLVLQHSALDKAQAEAERVHQMLALRIAQRGLAEVSLIGPAPCFVARLRGRYRWQIIVKADDVHPLLNAVDLPTGWTVDIDPVSLL